MALKTWILVALCLLIQAIPLAAADPDERQLEFFEKRVRPVLIEWCYDCHSGDAVESEFRADSRAGLLKGGTRGPAIVPGQPDRSLLILAVNHADQLHMPPKTKIPTREIADLTTWVKAGAHWPNAAPLPQQAKPQPAGTLFTQEQRDFWAFQKPVQPPLPPVAQPIWVTAPIDYFVLARLEAAGLAPAPPADRRTLIRRATFDLTGLPPTIEEVSRFLADDRPDAFSRLVDRLLNSPRYGERWGRHWLDVARYADSNGMDENLAYANAFRYRDYVVAAFNKDKSYARFIEEQLAGDLLPDDEPGAAAGERLCATGFLSLGAKMLAEDDPMKMQMDIVDEQVDTVGRAFMGLTLSCARCHDHKFDPFPTADYYSLAGIFKSTRTMENFNVVARWQERPLADAEMLKRQHAHQQQIAQQKAQIQSVVERANEQLLSEARRHVGQYLLAAAQQQQLQEVLARIDAAQDSTALPTGIILIEAEKFSRGNVSRLSSGYGEGIGVIAGPGGLNFAEYDIDVPQAGRYHVALRYAAADARPTRLMINGQHFKADVAGNVTGSWYPDTQTWSVEGICKLDQGNCTLRLERDNPFPHIDKLIFVPATADASSTLHPAESDVADANSEVQSAPPYALKPGFVTQWARYLASTKEDLDGVMSAWHAYRRDQSLGPDAGELARGLQQLLVLRKRTSLGELAHAYQQLFAEADRAWRELKATPAGQQASGLADPIQEALRKLLYDPQGPFALPKNPEPDYPQATIAELHRQRQQLTALEQSLPKLPEAMAVSEGEPEDLRIHIRGSHVTLGAQVPRQFPQIIAGTEQTPISDQGSGRLQLARWLTSPNHPLVSRVMVNRIWQGHFGAALVRSPDNFGRLGERPTHPQLLDYLALQFVEDGWSIKAMHRRIMLSSTYQMSTAWNEQAAAVDPENRLLWRMNRRRLEAEAIRDAILAMGKTLDLTIGGTLLPTQNRAYVTSTANVDPVVYESTRRSLYLPVVRSALYDVFQAFDFADPSVLHGTRQSTTVAPQALFIMNSQLVAQQTRSMAVRLLGRNDLDDRQRLQLAFQQAFSRPPSEQELTEAENYLERYVQAMQLASAPRDARLRAWQSLCRAILSTNEFIYVE